MPATALTEQQYRRWSGDTRSPWHSTGNSIGAEEIVQLVEEEIAGHLSTYLQPTQVTETYRPVVLQRDQLGSSFVELYHVLTHHKRLLTDRTITVTWNEWLRADCTSTTTTGCAIVLDALLGKLDLSKCLSSCGICIASLSCDVLTVDITYTSGFVALPMKIQRAIALLARYDVMELIVGVTPTMSDLPWGAPVTQRSDLGMSRSFDAPFRYAAGNQGVSVFGRGHVGIAAEGLVGEYRVFGAWQI